MDQRNFLLNVIKFSPLLIKLALMSITRDKIDERTMVIPPKIFTEIDSTLTTLLELVRQQQYFQARDILVKIRFNLIRIRPTLYLTLEAQGLLSVFLAILLPSVMNYIIVE